MAYTITKRRTTKGIAFDLYFRWKGQRYRPLLGYDLSPDQAQQCAIELIHKIQTQEVEKPRSLLTLHDILPLYWQVFEVKKRIDRTRPKGILENHILSCHACVRNELSCSHRFGHQPLASLRPEDGLRYVKARLDEGATAGTVRREWQVLNRILNVAVRYEKLDRNPLKHVELPDAEKRTRIAESEELSLISKMRENDPTKLECRQELWRIIQVAVSVGLREGKILEIERSWVKKREDGYWLCLPPAASRIKGTPQEVPLNRTAMLALGAEIPSLADGRVFRRWTHQRAFKEYWSETCRRVGIHDLHFHDLRHTFATRLQRIGVDYEVRQALLGHRMPGMTANYSHGGPEWDRKLRSAVEGLEKAYPLSYGLSYETKAAVGQTAEVIDLNGESAGIRTQDPRLKRSKERFLTSARYCNGFPNLLSISIT